MEERLAIGEDMTASELHDELARVGAGLMLRAMGALSLGQLDCAAQGADGVTYAAKIDKAEARVDWSDPAESIARKIRGLSPFPGAWCDTPDGRLKLLNAIAVPGTAEPGQVLEGLTIACGTGAVRIDRAQREGKRPMEADDLLRGLDWPPGTRLG